MRRVCSERGFCEACSFCSTAVVAVISFICWRGQGDMRIVTLNIQSGGAHPRISFMWDFLLTLKPDCIILTKFTSSIPIGQWLRDQALMGGFPYARHAIRDTPKSRGVLRLIASN